MLLKQSEAQKHNGRARTWEVVGLNFANGQQVGGGTAVMV
jgi:hypothetical protein